MRLHLPSARAFARDTFHALGILAAVAAVTDYATEAKHLRAHCAALEDAATRLRFERDVSRLHADRLMDGNRDLVALAQMQAEHIRELTTLDDDAEYEPASPVYGPAEVEQQVAEFRGEIERELGGEGK